MNAPLRVLHLEDDVRDAKLVHAALVAEGIPIELTRVETELDFVSALNRGGCDLILADYTLPSFDGLSALRIAQRQLPDVPFIFVSGTLGEEVAIEALKTGATDFVLKTRLRRLGPAVTRALREAREKAGRMDAEEALRRSEKELRNVIETIPTFAWTALPDGSIDFANRYWVEFTGLSIEESIGSGWEVAVHPEDAGRNREKWLTSIETGEPFENEVRYRSADGQYRWFLGRAVPLRDVRGRIVKWYGISTDVEDRKRAEEARQRSEDYLTEAQTLSHTGSFGWKISTDEHFWSDETFRIWEYDDSTKVTLQLILDRIHPEDIPRAKQIIARAAEDGQDFELEYRLLLPSGSVKHIHVVAHAVGGDSGNFEFIGVVMDITERKRTQEALNAAKARFEGILEIAEDAIISMDSEQRIVLFNQGAEKVFGYGQAEVIGKPLDLLLPQRFAHSHRGHIEAFAKSPEASRLMAQRREVFGRRKDGSEFPAEASISKLSLGNEVVFTVILRDITERKHAQQALEKTFREVQALKDEFQQVLNTIPGMVWSNLPDGHVDFLNQRWLEFTGLTFEQASGSGWQAAIHPDDMEMVAAYRKRVLTSGEAAQMEVRLRRHDGVYRWLLVNGVSLYDKSGKIVKRYGLSTDIEDRKQAEEKLRRSEQQWKDVFENNPTMYFMVKADGTILSVNPFGAEQLGYTVDELIGSPVMNIFYEPDRIAVQEKVAGCLKQLGRSISWEFRKVRKDGSVLWVRETARAVIRDDQPIVLVACEDITERKHAEEALRRSETLLAEGERISHTGSWVYRPATGELTSSKERFRIFGLNPDKTPSSTQVFSERVHPDDKPRLRKILDSAIREERDFEFEYRIVTPDGAIKHVHTVAHAITNESGELLEFFGSTADITERKRAEEKIQQSEAELRQLVDVIPQQVCVFDADWNPLFANQREREYTGLTLEEVKSKEALAKTFHPEDQKKLEAVRKRARLEPVPFELEARIKGKDGQYRWFLVRDNPLRDERGRVLRWYATRTDIEDRRHAESLLAGEKRVLEMVAKGYSLSEILDSLCRLAEELASGVLTSILLVDGNRLWHGGAPSLPKAYTDAIDGVVIGPAVGSCGTAAYRCEQVIVEDIATNPLWADYREAALPHSLRACWSTPVFSSEGNVIATFAMYYREPRSPSRADQEIIEQVTHLAGVAIERKLTEEALRRSETYLVEAQKLTRTGSWARNPATGEILYCSEEMFRIFGFDPRQGMPTDEMIRQRTHPDDLEQVLQAIEKGRQQKTDYLTDFRIVLPDGTTKHIQTVAHIVVSETREVVEWFGTAMDVTERKKAEEAIHRSEAFLAEGQRISHTGSWVWNPTTGEMTSSKERFLIFGLDPEKTKPSFDVFWERVHPEDKPRFKRVFDAAVREKSDFNIGCRIVTPDWVIKHIHTVAHAITNESGELIEFIGSTMDITERKRAEERAQSQNNEVKLALNAFVGELDLNRFLGHVITGLTKQFQATASELWLSEDSSSAAKLYMTCEQGKVVRADERKPTCLQPRAAHIKRERPDIGRIPRIIELPAHKSLLRPAHLESLKDQGVKTLLLVPLVLGEQNLGFVELRFAVATRLTSDDLNLAQALVHHATLALQLSRLAHRTEQMAVTEERNRMAREIHDTLAQAFAGIVLHSEALGTALEGSKARSRKSLLNIQKLARSGLEEARRSVQALRPKALDDRSLAQALEEEVKQFSEYAKLSCEFKQRGKVWEMPVEVQNELFRVAQEAMTNVRRHARAKSAWINLEFKRRWVILTIRDNGVGLAAPNSSKRKQGYGLTTMRERTQRIGGKLEIESPASGGTTIRVEVPFAKPLERSNYNV